MKRILILLLVFLIPFSAFSAEEEKKDLDPEGWWNALWENSNVCFDLFARSTFVRGGFTAGGGFSGGIETDQFRFDIYALTDYFLDPLGSMGALARMEFMIEGGVSLGWKFLKFWSFTTYVSCDIGYYCQFLVYPGNEISELNSVFNGLMLRPKLMTELEIAKYYSLSVGVFYQFPVIPTYSDYNGFGILFSIM